MMVDDLLPTAFTPVDVRYAVIEGDLLPRHSRCPSLRADFVAEVSRSMDDLVNELHLTSAGNLGYLFP